MKLLKKSNERLMSIYKNILEKDCKLTVKVPTKRYNSLEAINKLERNLNKKVSEETYKLINGRSGHIDIRLEKLRNKFN